jgi:hypothetical protein
MVSLLLAHAMIVPSELPRDGLQLSLNRKDEPTAKSNAIGSCLSHRVCVACSAATSALARYVRKQAWRLFAGEHGIEQQVSCPTHVRREIVTASGMFDPQPVLVAVQLKNAPGSGGDMVHAVRAKV